MCHSDNVLPIWRSIVLFLHIIIHALLASLQRSIMSGNRVRTGLSQLLESGATFLLNHGIRQRSVKDCTNKAISIMIHASRFAGDLAGSMTSSARPSTGNGIFARFLAVLAKGRERQAEREVARYLARQPDRLLKDIGFDAAAIAELRARDAA
jgi:hypothetical protein